MDEPSPSGSRRFFRPGLFRMTVNLICGLIALCAGALGLLSIINGLRYPGAHFTEDMLFFGVIASWVVPGTTMLLASLFFFAALRKKRKDLWRRAAILQICTLIAQILPIGMLVVSFAWTSRHRGEWSGFGQLFLVGLGILFFMVFLGSCITLVTLYSDSVRSQFTN